MKKPETAEEFRKFEERQMSKRKKEDSLLEAAFWSIIDYFMIMVPEHSGFGPSEFSKPKDAQSAELCCRMMRPCYDIRLEYWKDDGFHFWIFSYLPWHVREEEPDESKDPGVWAHVMDADFEIFWKKSINLMCKIFNLDLIFPEVDILQTKRDWLEYKRR